MKNFIKYLKYWLGFQPNVEYAWIDFYDNEYYPMFRIDYLYFYKGIFGSYKHIRGGIERMVIDENKRKELLTMIDELKYNDMSQDLDLTILQHMIKEAIMMDRYSTVRTILNESNYYLDHDILFALIYFSIRWEAKESCEEIYTFCNQQNIGFSMEEMLQLSKFAASNGFYDLSMGLKHLSISPLEIKKVNTNDTKLSKF